MHPHKTVSQMLLILFILNPVLAAPVVREMHDARGDVAVPMVVRSVAVMSKERRQSTDGPTPSQSSPPAPDGLTPAHSSPQFSDATHSPPQFPDGSMLSHSPPPPPDGPTPSHSLQPFPDGLMPSPPPLVDGSTPGGTAALPVAPMTDQHDMLAVPPANRVLSQELGKLIDKAIIGTAVLAIAGGLITYYRLHKRHHRTTDCYWYVSNPLPPLESQTS